MVDVHTVNRKMKALWRDECWAEAAELATSLPEDDLIWGAHADLWWHFCEDLGDAVRENDAELASRLYCLAIASYVKEGTMATGAGEGLASKSHQNRIEKKRSTLTQSD